LPVTSAAGRAAGPSELIIGTAFTAANVVPVSDADNVVLPINIADLAPSEGSGITIVNSI
jgi:hypothetical protein